LITKAVMGNDDWW